MKKGVHPDNYRPVVFQDTNDNSTIITRSTAVTDESITVDGVEYPVQRLDLPLGRQERQRVPARRRE